MSPASMARRLAFAILLMVTAFHAAPAPAQEVPDVDVQEALIKEALITLNDANMTGNYEVMQLRTAKVFQEQFSADDLAGMFSDFSEQEIDISTIAGLDFLEDAPTLVLNGVLNMGGHFETRPLEVNYRLKFIVENDRWALIGITVTTKPVE